MKAYRKYMYVGLPVLGVLFYLFYLHRAAIDLVYSDYIRLTLSYLPDVWDPEKFFVPDLLTRIPVNFLERAVNVELFGYSVTFDRVLGVLGFGLSALILGGYSRKMRIGAGWFTAMMVFMFSLNKWEMLYNGTGWAHFLAFGCFFYNYYVLERVYGSGGEKKGDMARLLVLPALVTIGVAGPYCAIYIMTLVLAYLFVFVRRQTGWKRTALLLATAVLPLVLYLWSNSMAVYEYSGAVEGSMVEALREDPVFLLKFLLKSFASMIFGVELINRHMAEVPGIVCGRLFSGAVDEFLLWDRKKDAVSADAPGGRRNEPSDGSGEPLDLYAPGRLRHELPVCAPVSDRHPGDLSDLRPGIPAAEGRKDFRRPGGGRADTP